MYILNNWYKFLICVILIVGYNMGTNIYSQKTQISKTETAAQQLDNNDKGITTQNQKEQSYMENNLYVLGWLVVGMAIILIFLGDIMRCITKASAMGAVLCMLMLVGCAGKKPFEPVKLETISNTEEAFLIPLTGDAKVQGQTDKEAYLKENMVFTKQVKIPQQWVSNDHETYNWHGKWEDAAVLIKVDTQPVTREWTADPNSGTSNKNEAIWVMTSDQVEFSTGWQCTARIKNKQDAIKFLFNYPNGSLKTVLDTEVRGKLQTAFGLEVTDLPMETLRKAATPHIMKVVTEVTAFFETRGITITNLGISGGFVYKDKSIMDTMVKVFNAEQEKAIAAAESAAQEERNKKVIFEATGKADALLKTKKAEADGIKLVADAKLYELEKNKEQFVNYVQLKQLELQKDLILKWDGSYPKFMSGGNGSNPQMLLSVPPLDDKK